MNACPCLCHGSACPGSETGNGRGIQTDPPPISWPCRLPVPAVLWWYNQGSIPADGRCTRGRSAPDPLFSHPLWAPVCLEPGRPAACRPLSACRGVGAGGPVALSALHRGPSASHASHSALPGQSCPARLLPGGRSPVCGGPPAACAVCGRLCRPVRGGILPVRYLPPVPESHVCLLLPPVPGVRPAHPVSPPAALPGGVSAHRPRAHPPPTCSSGRRSGGASAPSGRHTPAIWGGFAAISDGDEPFRCPAPPAPAGTAPPTGRSQ